MVGSNPAKGTYEKNIEIYSPAYLFTVDQNGQRHSGHPPDHHFGARRARLWQPLYDLHAGCSQYLFRGPRETGLTNALVRFRSTRGRSPLHHRDRRAQRHGAAERLDSAVQRSKLKIMTRFAKAVQTRCGRLARRGGNR